MKRFHVHVNVTDLEANMRFYANLFGVEPTVVKSDYAKWMLDDPRLNFAISVRDRAPGVDHLGLQAEDEDELATIGQRLAAADAVVLAESGTTCCYARSDKYWAEDPQGLRWETFRTLGDAANYFAPAADATCCGPAIGASTTTTPATDTGCCGPAASKSISCCG